MKAKTIKIIFFLILALAANLIFAAKVFAVCPVCAVAVGAGVGLSRWLGIDDLISGIWIGGLLVSMTIWLLDYLKKKNIKFKGQLIGVTFLFYALTIGPLYWTGIAGHPYNQYLGVDKLIFGIAVGTVVFFAAVLSHNFLKRKNNNKSYFPFQKVALPLLFLIISSAIFYLIIKP
jgi:hypothetical protein